MSTSNEPMDSASSEARDWCVYLQLFDDAVNTQQGVVLLWMVCNISSGPCTFAAACSDQGPVKLSSISGTSHNIQARPTWKANQHQYFVVCFCDRLRLM